MARILDSLRHRVRTLRNDGAGRVFRFQVGTLERAESLLDRAPDVAVFSAAEKLVERRLNAVSAPAVDGYDDLNAKDAIRALSDLRYVDLLKVRRWERSHKARKTVLQAVDRQLERFKLAA